jgi:hypothetical protein
MGEISGGADNTELQLMQNRTATVDGKFETDVEGVFAHGNKDGVPVFDVEQDEFYKNMKMDRKRMRFKTGSDVATYMQRTRYNRPFFIKHGEYLRKIK